MAKTRKAIRHTFGDKIFLTVDFIILFTLLIIIAYPLIYIFFASFNAQVTKMGLSLIPEKWSIQGYKAVFEYKFIWSGYLNTLIYTTVGTLINLFVTICCAYPLSRKDFKGRGFVMVMCMITMYFSGGLIPTYLVVKDLGMLNTMWSIVLPSAMSVYNMIVMRTYFDTQIPLELLESAQLDGCGNLNFLRRIVLPLSVPILVTFALYYGVERWNEWYNGMLFIRSFEKRPLQLVLRGIIQTTGQAMMTSDLQQYNITPFSEGIKMACIVVTATPIILVYPFMQKYFVKGITVGAVKG